MTQHFPFYKSFYPSTLRFNHGQPSAITHFFIVVAAIFFFACTRPESSNRKVCGNNRCWKCRVSSTEDLFGFAGKCKRKLGNNRVRATSRCWRNLVRYIYIRTQFPQLLILYEGYLITETYRLQSSPKHPYIQDFIPIHQCPQWLILGFLSLQIHRCTQAMNIFCNITGTMQPITTYCLVSDLITPFWLRTGSGIHR